MQANSQHQTKRCWPALEPVQRCDSKPQSKSSEANRPQAWALNPRLAQSLLETMLQAPQLVFRSRSRRLIQLGEAAALKLAASRGSPALAAAIQALSHAV